MHAGQVNGWPAFRHAAPRAQNLLPLLPVQEDNEEYAESGEKQAIPRSKRPVTKHWNWLGLAICLYYVAAALYYFIIRGAYTLNMGYLG